LLLRQSVRYRFWVEAGLGTLSIALLVLTLLAPDWIEAIFSVDPDQHNGSLEWAISGLFLVASLLAGALARLEWQRPRLAARAEPAPVSPPPS
jgi:hypothetical protein